MRSQIKQFWPDVVGFKYKMSNIQAAIGCAQMQRINELTSRKRESLSIYRQELAQLPEISINPEYEGIVNGAWMPTVVFSEKSCIRREKIRQQTKAMVERESNEHRVSSN
jgi:perosamine synthetase